MIVDTKTAQSSEITHCTKKPWLGCWSNRPMASRPNLIGNLCFRASRADCQNIEAGDLRQRVWKRLKLRSYDPWGRTLPWPRWCARRIPIDPCMSPESCLLQLLPSFPAVLWSQRIDHSTLLTHCSTNLWSTTKLCSEIQKPYTFPSSSQWARYLCTDS